MAAESSRSGKSLPISTSSDLGQAVRAARKRFEMNQAQLAGLAGTGLRFISDLERGKPSIALDKVLAVLAVLGLRLRVDGDAL